MGATFGSDTHFVSQQPLKTMCVWLAATCERHSNNFGRRRNTFKGVFFGGSKNKVRLVFVFAVDEKQNQAPFFSVAGCENIIRDLFSCFSAARVAGAATRSHCAQASRHLSHGWMDGWRDRWTDRFASFTVQRHV